MNQPELYQIQIVYGEVAKQTVLSLSVLPGTRVADAIKQSNLQSLWPNKDLSSCTVGIFGKKIMPDTLLKNGDRIELYRPLIIDPKQARKLRAIKNNNMLQYNTK